MAARATILDRHLRDLDKNRYTVFSPTKGFDCSEIIQMGFSGTFVYDLRKVSFKSQSKSPFRPSDELKSACYANIDPKSTGLLLSKAPLKQGKIPTKIYKTPKSLIIASKRMKEDYRDILSGYNIISGGWTGSRYHFERFTNGSRFVTSIFKRRIKNINNLDIRCGSPQTLNTPKMADIYYMPFRGDSVPGGDSTWSASRKKELWFSACYTASRLWEVVHTKPTPCVSIYTIGGKEKVSNFKGQAERLQSRVIMQQDQVEFHLAKPYVRNIEMWLFNNHELPIVVGKSLTSYKWTTLTKALTKYKNGIEFDWSKYDSTVLAEYIIAAFAWCRSLFEESDAIDNAFVYFCHGFLEKYVVTPDGNTFKISRGVPSGTAWTTIINSVVNALIMEDLLDRYPPFCNKDSSYMVAGDDGVLLFNEEISFNKEVLVKWIKKKTDMDMEIIKVGRTIAEHPDDSLSFNKKVLYWNGDFADITTQPKLLAKRLFPMSKGSTSYKNMLNTLDGQYSEILNHKDCLNILRICSEGVSGDSTIHLDVMSRAMMTTKLLYEVTRDENMYSRDEYSVDKLHPLDDKYLFNSPIDFDYVENWLVDNTMQFFSAQPLKVSRLSWFHKKMSYPVAVSVLYDTISRSSNMNLYRYNFRKELKFINAVWDKWYVDTPQSINWKSFYT